MLSVAAFGSCDLPTLCVSCSQDCRLASSTTCTSIASWCWGCHDCLERSVWPLVPRFGHSMLGRSYVSCPWSMMVPARGAWPCPQQPARHFCAPVKMCGCSTGVALGLHCGVSIHHLHDRMTTSLHSACTLHMSDTLAALHALDAQPMECADAGLVAQLVPRETSLISCMQDRQVKTIMRVRGTRPSMLAQPLCKLTS